MERLKKSFFWFCRYGNRRIIPKDIEPRQGWFRWLRFALLGLLSGILALTKGPEALIRWPSSPEEVYTAQYSQALIRDFGSGEAATEATIRTEPALALHAVHHIFNQSISAELRGETTKARELQRVARTVAHIAVRLTGRTQYTDLFQQLSQWGPLEKKRKLQADIALIQGLKELKQKTAPHTAITKFQQAAVHYQKINDRTSLAEVYAELAVAYLLSAQMQEAMDYGKKSLLLAEELGDEMVLQKALSLLGFLNTHIPQKDIDAAIRYCLRAVEINQRLKYETGLVTSLIWLSMAYTGKRDYNSALAVSKQALELRDKITDPYTLATLDFYTGHLYMHLYDHAAVLYYLQQALQGPLRPELRAFALNSIADIYCHHFDAFDRCLDYSQQALALSRAVYYNKGLAYALCNLGYSEFKLGRHAAALEHLQTAYAVATKHNIQDLTGRPLYCSGEIKLALDRPREALSDFEYVLKHASTYNNTNMSIMGLLGIADAHRALGNIPEAIVTYMKAVDQIEASRSSVGSDKLRGLYLSKRLRPYLALVELLAESGDTSASFLYSERIKARTLIEAIARRQRNIPRSDLSPLLNLKQRLGQANQNLDAEEAKEKSGPAKRDAARSELRRARRALEDYLEKLDAQSPVIFQSGAAASHLNLDAARAALDPQVAIVSYTVLSNYLLAWVLDTEGIHLEKIHLSSDDLRRYIANLRQPLEDYKTGRILLRDITWDASLAHGLYLKIFAPLERYVHSKKHIVLIPDDILFYLPFEALVTESPQAGAKSYLIQKYSISYAPSVTALSYIFQPKPKRERSLLALGNPDYGAASHLKRLPSSAEEVGSLSLYFRDRRVYTDQQATEAQFKLEAPRYRILHLSAHGLINDQEPLFSRIALRSSSEPFEDGYLETHEVLSLNLQAELVTLSACESGIGSLLKGEGMVGLSNAFFIAGASSVVSSLWPVQDRAATDMMKIFYRALMQEGLSKSAALRKAKLSFISAAGSDREILSNPMIWGSFIIIGDYH